MKDIFIRTSKTERGQAILEFAMILPVLFLMLIGVTYFAMGFNLHQVLDGAAAEAARTWARNPVVGSFGDCSPPKCNPSGKTCADGGYDPKKPDCNSNFVKYIVPVVRNYVTNHGFDGNKVIFQSQSSLEAATNSESVTVTIYYPYNLLASAKDQEGHPTDKLDYVTVTVSASCTMKKGGG